jgi:hypothetical protein
MTKIQNSKRLGHWILEFGAWDLRFLNTSIPRDIKDYLSFGYSPVKFHTRIPISVASRVIRSRDYLLFLDYRVNYKRCQVTKIIKFKYIQVIMDRNVAALGHAFF